MVTLNAGAAEFHPSNNHKLQQSIDLPSQQYYCSFFLSSSSPFRQLNNPFFYYPTTPILTIPYTTPIPYYFHLPNQKQHHFSSLEEAELTTIHLEEAAHDDHEQHQQNKEVVVVAEKPGGAKRNNSIPQKKQVFQIISRMDGHRADGKMRLPDYAWRRQAKEIAEEYKKSERHRFLKNRRQHNFRAFPHPKKQPFPLIPVRPDGDETTVMIKNIPSKYTRDLLVRFLENHCKLENEKDGEENTLAFDFVYLPMDFESGMSKGYAFVNFTNPRGARKFVFTASDRNWDLFQSNKIREVVLARIQGKEKLEAHFETMSFPSESEAVLPVWFSPPRDGVTKGRNQRTMGNLLKNHRTHNHL